MGVRNPLALILPFYLAAITSFAPGGPCTSKGSVLAYAETRKRLRGDWRAIDTMLRRSTGGCYNTRTVAYNNPMAALFLEESLSVLTRTPATLNLLLRDLPEAWTTATEGPGTWSPYVIIGHLIHGEKTDWMTGVYCLSLN